MRSQRIGRRFDPVHLHQYKLRVNISTLTLVFLATDDAANVCFNFVQALRPLHVGVLFWLAYLVSHCY
jgi:hypothetical protein